MKRASKADREAEVAEWVMNEGGHMEPEGTAGEGQQQPPADDKTPGAVEALKLEMEKMRTAFAEESRANSIRMLAHVAELVKQSRNPDAAKPPQTGPELNDEKLAQMYQAAQENPGILPAVIRTHMDSTLKKELSTLKDDLVGMLDKREADAMLRNKLGEYADDFSSTSSKIMPKVPEAKEMLKRFLSPEVIGTEVHDRLAYLLAAGTNPQLVGEREMMRLKAEEEAREQQRMRMSDLGGGGGKAAAKDPTLTDEDRELFTFYGLDINDPAIVKEILEAKKTERLPALDGSNVIGFGG